MSRPTRLKPCAESGCPELTENYRCDLHQAGEQRRAQAWVYNTTRWKAVSRYVRRVHPTCVIPGCTNPSDDVDHIIPLRDGGDPYDLDNLEALCRHHHNLKTRGGGL